jgi:hypothetical protein
VSKSLEDRFEEYGEVIGAALARCGLTANQRKRS